MAESKFADPVHAVTLLSGCEVKTQQAQQIYLQIEENVPFSWQSYIVAGVWLTTVAESKFADPVHAVTLLPGCVARAQQAQQAGGLEEVPPGVVVAAVGQRLVAFEEKNGRLWKRHLAATAQPVTCLSPGSSPGTFTIR